jgi:hypothetical protein
MGAAGGRAAAFGGVGAGGVELESEEGRQAGMSALRKSTLESRVLRTRPV